MAIDAAMFREFLSPHTAFLFKEIRTQSSNGGMIAVRLLVDTHACHDTTSKLQQLIMWKPGHVACTDSMVVLLLSSALS
jgi:hypothetical protein